jgi:hypothetical protein
MRELLYKSHLIEIAEDQNGFKYFIDGDLHLEGFESYDQARSVAKSAVDAFEEGVEI